MKKVEILSGLPGSGKSTWAKAYRDVPNDPVICSADDYFMVDGKYLFDAAKLKFAHAYCLDCYVTCVRSSVDDIIVDNTNLAVEEIAPYYALAEAYGYDVKIRLFNASADVCLKRQTHGVPEHAMRRMEANRYRLRDELNRIARWKALDND